MPTLPCLKRKRKDTSVLSSVKLSNKKKMPLKVIKQNKQKKKSYLIKIGSKVFCFNKCFKFIKAKFNPCLLFFLLFLNPSKKICPIKQLQNSF